MPGSLSAFIAPKQLEHVFFLCVHYIRLHIDASFVGNAVAMEVDERHLFAIDIFVDAGNNE